MRHSTLTRTVVGILAAGALVFCTAGACGGSEDQGPAQQQQQGGDQGDDDGGDQDGGDQDGGDQDDD